MTTLEKLELAKSLMEKAEELIDGIIENPENDSLIKYYGYSLKIITQELNKFSTNSRSYLTSDVSLDEIINEEGENWTDDSNCDGVYIEDLLDELDEI